MSKDNAYNTAALAYGRLAEIAPEVAKILGWEVANRGDRENQHYIEIFKPGHAYHRIGLYVGFPYGKLGVSAQFKHSDAKGKEVFSLPYKTERPSINVSLSKSPTQIAADITRRLLPDAVPLWKLNQERVEEYAAHDLAVAHGVKRLSGVIGAPLSRVNDTRHADRVDVYASKCLPEALADFTVTGAGEVRIDGLRVSLDEAEAILRLLVASRLGKK